MTTEDAKTILIAFIAAVILAIIASTEAKAVTIAELTKEYMNEAVPYIVINSNRILPEDTSFKCENKVLYKNQRVVRMHTGKAKRCDIIYTKRKDYGKTYIPTLHLF